MTQAKHTPGPWKQGDYIVWPTHGGNAQFPIHAPKRGRIALALTKEADARLIAAAPELLEALRKISFLLSATNDDPGEPSFMPEVRAAIAKAEGQS